MAILIELDNLPDSLVVENLDILKAYLEAAMEDQNPDLTKGTVLYDLLLRPAAIMHSLNESNIYKQRASNSLQEIAILPGMADDRQVDALLSNYRIERREGKLASGQVNIFISTNVVTAIPSGSIFVVGNLRFLTQESFVGVPSQELVSTTTDRLIRQVNASVFVFTIDVIAEREGSSYQLNQNDDMVLQTPSSNYIISRAAQDFTTGANMETNDDLVDRLEVSLADRTPANRTNTASLLMENFPDIQHTSIIGFGQTEMRRDQINMFRTSYGGKSDVYVQTEPRPQTVQVIKQAVLVDKNRGRWQMYFDREEFAGVYKLVSILRQDQDSVDGTLAIESEVREIDASPSSEAPDSYIPDIEDYSQGAFSRYQTMTVEFIDPYEDTTELVAMQATKDYVVNWTKMADIAAMQDDVMSKYDLTNHRYDDLVRAAIPVLMSVTVGIRLRAGETINEQGVKQAIADRINMLSFRNRLSSSYIVDAVHDMMGNKSSLVMPVDMIGELISPADGSSQIYRSATELYIPEDDQLSISKRTVMFFIAPSDVDIFTEVAT